MNIYLVRHAECFKNLIGIPGGDGASLTPLGIMQANKLGEALRPCVEKKATLIACPPRQTAETAAIIGRTLGIDSKIEPLFASINLGVLNGVPIKEASSRYPKSSASMERWRSNLSEIEDLQIDGMENPWDFYKRGLRGILKYRKCENLIVCSTTSIMILFIHISNKITPRAGDGYKSIEFENAEIMNVVFDNSMFEWFYKILDC